MGDLSFSEMKSLVTMHVGNRDEWSDVDGADFFGIWVNQAYKEVCATDFKKKIPQLETSATSSTSAGVAYISSPARCLAIRTVLNSTSSSTLEWTPLEEYLDKTDRATTSSRGVPSKWTRSGERLYLYPTPDSTYSITVYYKQYPVALSGDGDYTAIDSVWDEPIVVLATYKAFAHMNESENAKIVLAEYQRLAGNILSVYDSDQNSRTESIRPDPTYFVRRRR